MTSEAVRKQIGIIGGGMASVSILRGLVHAARSTGHANFDVTIFEKSSPVGPGVAYRLDLPNSAILNHEMDHMGCVNARQTHFEADDFYLWVQHNLACFEDNYPGYDLTNPREYVPRSLYGLYLRDQYLELVRIAESLGIRVREVTGQEVQNIQQIDGQYAVEVGDDVQCFDECVIATGTHFNSPEREFPNSDKAFGPYTGSRYLNPSHIRPGSTLLIKGTGLTAYDVALSALDSGIYDKVVMASRHGSLRRVRGAAAPYRRECLTLHNLQALAGGPREPFQLEHVEFLLKQELRAIYGRDVDLTRAEKVDDIIERFRKSAEEALTAPEVRWRSMLQSISFDERNEIYQRLRPEDKEAFFKFYSAIMTFIAPVPAVNAEKLLGLIEEGKLEIQNGYHIVVYDEEQQKFVLTCKHTVDGGPVLTPDFNSQAQDEIISTIEADVFVDASGVSRSIHLQKILSNLAKEGLAQPCSFGGVHFDEDSSQITVDGNAVRGLYCIGSMQMGQSLVPVNSFVSSERGYDLGAQIALSCLVPVQVQDVRLDLAG